MNLVVAKLEEDDARVVMKNLGYQPRLLTQVGVWSVLSPTAALGAGFPPTLDPH